MHITNDFDDALRKWRKEGFCTPCSASPWVSCDTLHDAMANVEYTSVAYRPFVLGVFADEFEEDIGDSGIYRYPGPALLKARENEQRASTLSHDFAIDYDDAMALVKASSSDTAIRLIVTCCVLAGQPIAAGVSILKGAGLTTTCAK